MIKATTFPIGEHLIPNSRPVWKQAMADLGRKDERVIALNADLSRPTFTDQFKDEFPNRFYNVGIAEQNMVGMAAGLALKGKIPYAVTYTPFATMRAGEQFRTDCCYQNLPVRLVGVAAGLSPAGATHSGIEDAGIIRTMPNSTVVAPADPYQFGKVLEASLSYEGPMYIRLGFGMGEHQIYDGDYDFEIGKAIEAKAGKDATIFSFGTIISDALKAADALAKEGIDVQVVDMHTIKPIDKDAVMDAINGSGRIVTVEDHNVIGGLGTAVAEVIADSGKACKFQRVGIPDCFAHFGGLGFLHKTYGYDVDAIVAAVKKTLQ